VNSPRVIQHYASRPTFAEANRRIAELRLRMFRKFDRTLAVGGKVPTMCGKHGQATMEGL
jgi:hypothetical protein